MSAAASPARSLLDALWDDSPTPKPGNLMRRAWNGEGDHGRVGPVLGLFAFGLLLAGLLIQLPTPALHGEGLVGMLGLLTVTGALLVELTIDPGTVRWGTALGLAICLGSATVAAVQPGGTAVIGCYVGVGMSARRLPRTNALLVAVPTVVAVATLILLSAENNVFTALWAGIGFVFSFMISRLARVGEEQGSRERALIEEEKLALAARTEAAALAERGRIAREMHDVLAHSLSALAVELEGARLLARKQGVDPKLEGAIERAHEHAAGGLREARSAIEALRGDDLPGPERLEAMAASFASEQDVECRFEVEGPPRRLASEAALAIYRTAQEALTNVRKHAEPERVEMRLRYAEDGTSLEVADHCGCPEAAAAEGPLAETGAGWGVDGMRERAELLGGRLEAGPTADGFRVSLWLPEAARA